MVEFAKRVLADIRAEVVTQRRQKIIPSINQKHLAMSSQARSFDVVLTCES